MVTDVFSSSAKNAIGKRKRVMALQPEINLSHLDNPTITVNEKKWKDHCNDFLN